MAVLLDKLAEPGARRPVTLIVKMPHSHNELCDSLSLCHGCRLILVQLETKGYASDASLLFRPRKIVIQYGKLSWKDI